MLCFMRYILYLIIKNIQGVKEMAEWLKTMDAPPEDLNSNPSNQ